MKIEMRYKEGTSIEDTSKDKVVITMTTNELINLQCVINVVKFNFKPSEMNIKNATKIAEELSASKRKIKWVK